MSKPIIVFHGPGSVIRMRRYTELARIYGPEYISLLTLEQREAIPKLGLVDRVKACEYLCGVYYPNVDWKKLRSQHINTYANLYNWGQELIGILVYQLYCPYKHGGEKKPLRSTNTYVSMRQRVMEPDTESDTDDETPDKLPPYRYLSDSDTDDE